MSVGSGTVSSPVGDANDDGFFGSITPSIIAGAGELFSQVLPVWVASQAGLQKTNQTNQPMYVADPNYDRINDGLASSGGFWQRLTGQSTAQRSSSNQTGAATPNTIGGVPVATIVVAGAAVLVIGALLYALKS